MNKEDKQLLEEFGLSDLDQEMQEAVLTDYYETLNLRLSMTLESRLSDKQLEAFDALHDAGDDQATLDWLREAIDDYDAIIDEETTSVKADITRNLDKYRAQTA